MKFTQKQQRQSGEGSSLFLKVKDGESVKGIFRGDIYEWRARWNQAKQTYEVEPNSDPGLNNRFKTNFVVHEEGKFIAKVFEYGLTVYEQLSQLAQHYDLEKTKVVISRKGQKTDTVWTVLPLPDKLGPQLLAQIEAVKLNALEPKGGSKSAHNQGPEHAMGNGWDNFPPNEPEEAFSDDPPF